MLILQQKWQKVLPEWQSLMRLYTQDNNHDWLNLCKNFDFEAKNSKQDEILPADVFYAFKHIRPQDIKIIILGQDPYHNVINNAAQAHGLAFSVPMGLPIPPSLMNMDKELLRDLHISPPIMPTHGNLMAWHMQGVMLLNSILSVKKHCAASHNNIGWQNFTNYLIKNLSFAMTNIVWMLWGKYAAQKVAFIDHSKHLILLTSHPSPLSAYRGFLGCGHFGMANQYLQQHNKPAINWQR
jgi:uracil-DNA glycosylase